MKTQYVIRCVQALSDSVFTDFHKDAADISTACRETTYCFVGVGLQLICCGHNHTVDHLYDGEKQWKTNHRLSMVCTTHWQYIAHHKDLLSSNIFILLLSNNKSVSL